LLDPNQPFQTPRSHRESPTITAFLLSMMFTWDSGLLSPRFSQKQGVLPPRCWDFAPGRILEFVRPFFLNVLGNPIFFLSPQYFSSLEDRFLFPQPFHSPFCPQHITSGGVYSCSGTPWRFPPIFSPPHSPHRRLSPQVFCPPPLEHSSCFSGCLRDIALVIAPPPLCPRR